MEGLIRQIWLRSDGSGAFAIVEAASAAAEKLDGLSMVRAGVLQAPVVVPMSPYWGFARRSK
jgi:hypothetical protein